jgi:hypothetical protein
MALISCSLHKITYNDRFDPTCPQCTSAGISTAKQLVATPGKFGAPLEEAPPGPPGTEV